MRRRPSDRTNQDSGAALILAIGFVLMVGAISAGLIGLATSSLNNRGTLERVRDREYAADGAIEQALAQVRLQAGSALVACTSANGSIVDTMNGFTIRVDWRHVCGVVQGSDGTVVAQRNVVLSACENTGATCLDAAVIIRARINLEQAATGAVSRTFVQSWTVIR